ncbi:MAG: hypothetical protein AAGF10_07290, partial [Verrucomicrobiota bacterium]
DVKYYMGGVIIVTHELEWYRHRYGVFVAWSDETPGSGSGIGFRKVRSRIFKVEEKIRTYIGSQSHQD